MTDLATLQSWPREKVVACVEYARKMGSITAGPLSPDISKWSDDTVAIVVAADIVMKFRPFPVDSITVSGKIEQGELYGKE